MRARAKILAGTLVEVLAAAALGAFFLRRAAEAPGADEPVLPQGSFGLRSRSGFFEGDGRIEGTVVDRRTGAPLSGVDVVTYVECDMGMRTMSAPKNVTTDAAGAFVFAD